MKFVIVFLSTIFAASCITAYIIGDKSVDEEWEVYKSKHAKKYGSFEEELARKVVFSENLYKINEHNKLFARGKENFSMGINKFSDRTAEEMKKYKGLKKNPGGVKGIEKVTFRPDTKKQVPDKFDWRNEGAVTEVKDQGSCGSCWAFSSVGALESQHFLKTGTLVTISEQNLIDCSNQGINDGCDGGDPTDAFAYVYLNDGIASEKYYPYLGTNDVCHYKQKYNVSSIRFYGDVEYGNEEYLKAAVATIGPVATDIYADDSFQNYESGVYYNGCCKEDDPDHSVLIVGYGTTSDDVEYWIVKNSWGEEWGEKGYIRMERNHDNNCGIASTASFPISY